MATPNPSLRDKCVSYSHFVSAIEAVKALHVFLAAVMTDVAALRRATLEDEELFVLYAKYLREASLSARPLLAEAIERYDQMISGEYELADFEDWTGPGN
jgi:hypothetical protein